MTLEQKRKKFSFKAAMAEINPLAIIFILVFLTVVLTFIVPGGEYQREEVEVMGMTKEVIIPGSFTFVDSIPQRFSQCWTAFMEGAVAGADVSFTILICSGALTAIIATGALNAAIGSLILKLKNKAYLLVVLLTFAFGLGGATYGMYEDAIPFVLILAPLMLALKFDSLVAVMIVQYGVAIGSASGFLNPFAVGIGQAMAGLPMTSGFVPRLFIWFALMSVTSLFIVRYARKIHKNPETSLVLEDDVHNRKKYESAGMGDVAVITKRDAAVLVSLFAGFAIMIYGVMKLGWWFNEIGSIFLFMGILIPLIGGMKLNEMISKNIEGMSGVLTAVIMISASRIIIGLLDESKIMDTILYALSSGLTELPKAVTVQIMYVATALMHAVMGSSSGVAATVMPIMAPLADVLEIPRQTIVLAYQLATGTFGYWVPWDGISFAMCSVAGINFFKYVKKSLRFAFCYYIPSVLIILTLAVTFNYS